MSYYPGQKPFSHPDLELKDPNKIAQQQQEFNSKFNQANQTPFKHGENIHHLSGVQPEHHKKPEAGFNSGVTSTITQLGNNQAIKEGFKPNPNCKKCEGTGFKKDKNKICKECSKQNKSLTEVCKKCNGTGYKIKDKTKKCKKCNKI
jgi:DnaJ-class molecular chaperone